MTARSLLAVFPEVQIHESCYVDLPCEIGAGTRIWHFTHVMRDCRIGRHCSIGHTDSLSLHRRRHKAKEHNREQAENGRGPERTDLERSCASSGGLKHRPPDSKKECAIW